MAARITDTRSTLPTATCLDEIGSTFEPVQNIHMPLILHHALKENRPHLEESGLRQQRVGAGLMLRSDALDLHVFSELVQASFEPFASFHEVLDVVKLHENVYDANECHGFGGT